MDAAFVPPNQITQTQQFAQRVAVCIVTTRVSWFGPTFVHASGSIDRRVMTRSSGVPLFQLNLRIEQTA
jgi:hypothetical protein